MKHYWNEHKSVEEINKISYYYRDKRYELNTSDGVFSKSGVDYGSSLLIDAVIEDIDLSASKNMLDVGCGYGAMSIVIGDNASNLKIDMVDISLRAIELSQININNYGFQDRLRVFESDKYEAVHDTYDYIITNPPIRTGKKNVHEIILNAIDYLKDNGSIYVVIQKKQGAKSAIKAMEAVYSKLSVITKSKGYFIIRGDR